MCTVWIKAIRFVMWRALLFFCFFLLFRDEITHVKPYRKSLKTTVVQTSWIWVSRSLVQTLLAACIELDVGKKREKKQIEKARVCCEVGFWQQTKCGSFYNNEPNASENTRHMPLQTRDTVSCNVVVLQEICPTSEQVKSDNSKYLYQAFTVSSVLSLF